MSGATVSLTLSSNATAFDSGEQVGLGGCEVGGSAGSLGGGGCEGCALSVADVARPIKRGSVGRCRGGGARTAVRIGMR